MMKTRKSTVTLPIYISKRKTQFFSSVYLQAYGRCISTHSKKLEGHIICQNFLIIKIEFQILGVSEKSR